MKKKLSYEEALAYVRKIEEENRALKNRCYVLSDGALCAWCTFCECPKKKGGEQA